MDGSHLPSFPALYDNTGFCHGHYEAETIWAAYLAMSIHNHHVPRVSN